MLSYELNSEDNVQKDVQKGAKKTGQKLRIKSSMEKTMIVDAINMEETIILTLVVYFKSLKQTNSNDRLRKFTLK